jgi:hypothetical protein
MPTDLGFDEGKEADVTQVGPNKRLAVVLAAGACFMPL